MMALWPERRLFIRRACSDVAKALGRTGIVKMGSAPQTPQRLEHIERTERDACQCLCRLSKGQQDRGLAREIVNLIRRDSLDDLSHRLEVGRRHRMEHDLLADAECNETIQPGKRRIARGPVDDIALSKEKARKILAVLP